MTLRALVRRAFEYGAIQKRDELLQLLAIVQRLRIRAALEIGTAAGGTLLCWCALADDDGIVVSIDLPDGEWGERPVEQMRAELAREGQALHLVRADSHDASTLANLKKLLASRQLDFLFIDGDHSYKGVKRDFEMYSPLVAAGGLIAFHDILPHPEEPTCEVHAYWRELREMRPHVELVAPPFEWGGIGLLWQAP